MPAALAWAGVGNGLSPICSSITSLPAAASRRATARTSNAVSALRLPANELKVVISPLSLVLCLLPRTKDQGQRTILLLRRDRLGERADHAGDDVAVHQLLAEPPLVLVRRAERLERLPAPVLADGEVDADRRLRELAGPHLERVRSRLDAQPGLQPALLVERQHNRRLEVEHLAAGQLDQLLQR